ncbi:MAG TPA: exo-beta-N-acetylmuramidase NamZ domain-containing protein [Candidatus Methylomirabilis sp.]|nr:exo-beta-N-acetylmuramidase NamZ domain-containing protein [Candidatus Methylomirabilis sp.]
MSRALVLTLLLALAAGTSALVSGTAMSAPRREAAPPYWPELDSAARDAVGTNEVPGAVILVGQGDRVLYRKAVGSRALVPHTEPMTADTIFDLASLTKVVATTPAVLLLWEQGRIDLDAPLGRYLKEFNTAAFQDVTVRRVLTHSAGLPDMPSREAMARRFPEAARIQARAGLAMAPGTAFLYSDTGFILLAEAVRRVSGEPLDKFVERRFYGPLGMRHTSFRPPDTWRPLIAPTEVVGSGGIPLRGVVHDGNARLLGGVAGHAGLFSTADDLTRYCRMLLGGGALDGRRYLKTSTVRAMFTPEMIGETMRGLGWDIASPYSRPLGSYFPIGSVGHTGFTGTSIWMDPETQTYAIVLTNRVHPYGKGNAVDLRRRVSAAVGVRLAPATLPPDSVDTGLTDGAATGEAGKRPQTLSGLDRLVAEGFAPLRGRSVGLVTNQTGVDAQGRRAIDLLAAAPGVTLRAVFSPEHGLDGQVDTSVPNSRDARTGLAVWSLYGATRRPSAEMLSGVNAIVFDIQDVGVRYYTYLATLVYVLEEAARRHIAVVVLDRPNPITGSVIEGPLMDPDLRSFTAPHPIPVRPGMTIGEFAKMVVGERKLPVDLTVIPLESWRRGEWYDQTGLPWANPSPNIRSPLQALLYSGIGLLETTNLSVGRGTDAPFELVGAPWIHAQELADAMNEKTLPGVRFDPISFTPSSSEYSGQAVGGVRLVVTDRDAIRPVTVALALGSEMAARYPQFRPAGIQNLLVNRMTMWAFLRGDSLMRIRDWAEAERASFLQRRASYLIYP